METIDLGKLPVNEVASENDLILAFNDATKRLQYVKMEALTKGGYACRRWNMSMATPEGEAVGDLEYLRNLPSMLGLGGYLVQKDHSRKKLLSTDHRRFADGSPAALDGTMGDYMWGTNTPCYYANWVEGEYFYEAFSLNPIPTRVNYRVPVFSTSAVGQSVMDRTTGELVSVVSDSPRYRGGRNNADLDAQFNTELGRGASNMSAAAFGTAARKKGDGWEAYWYTHHAIIGALFRVIMGTRNVQAPVNPSKDANGLFQGGLGAGVTTVVKWWYGSEAGQYNYGVFLPTSVGIEKGDFTGEIPYEVKGQDGIVLGTVNVPCFFGLKNAFGVMYKLERGRLLNKVAGGAADVYVMEKMYTNYSMDSLAGLKKVGRMPAAKKASTWEYITELSNQNLAHIPTKMESTSSTDYGDGVYNDNAESGLRVPCLGGAASYGGFAGLEYLAAYNGVATATVCYGSPLCEAAEDWDSNPIAVS